MDYHFSMEDCKFYVSEEKRTVACVIENTQRMFHDYINDKLYISCWGLPGTKQVAKFEAALDMPNRFVGIAKCAAEDKWDEELGKKIAYLRLREKVYHSFFNKARLYIDKLDDYLECSAIEINRMGAKLDREMESRNQYIAEKLSEKEQVKKIKLLRNVVAFFIIIKRWNNPLFFAPKIT